MLTNLPFQPADEHKPTFPRRVKSMMATLFVALAVLAKAEGKDIDSAAVKDTGTPARDLTSGFNRMLLNSGARIEDVATNITGQFPVISVGPLNLTNLVLGLKAFAPEKQILLFGFYPPRCSAPETSNSEKLAALRPDSITTSPRREFSSVRPGPHTILGLDTIGSSVRIYYPTAREMQENNPEIYQLLHPVDKISEAFMWPSLVDQSKLSILFANLNQATEQFKLTGSAVPKGNFEQIRANFLGDASQRESAFKDWNLYLHELDQWLVSSDRPALVQEIDPSRLPQNSILVIRSEVLKP